MITFLTRHYELTTQHHISNRVMSISLVPMPIVSCRVQCLTVRAFETLRSRGVSSQKQKIVKKKKGRKKKEAYLSYCLNIASVSLIERRAQRKQL